MASPALAAPAARFTSCDPDAFAPVTGREEEWRFTPLARLRGLHDGSAVVDEVLTLTLTAPAGASVETISAGHPLIGSVVTPPDAATARAMREVKEGQLVTLNGELDAPVLLHLDGNGGSSYGHVVIDAAPFSRATVVLEHTGTARHIGTVEVRVGDGADLTVVSLQDWARDAVHLSTQGAQLGRDARYRSIVVSLGGDLVRLVPTVTYAAPGGSAELFGVAFADAGQHLEHRLFVEHTAPHCRSRVTYKCAVQGADAHSVWIGDVAIRPDAAGTDTYELNRNLVLTDEARADSVPNLEIETGEIVGAGHASATGRFDDEQLFYLQSRGIEADEARRMVVRGFFADVLAHVDVPALQARLLARIDDELQLSGTSR